MNDPISAALAELEERIKLYRVELQAAEAKSAAAEELKEYWGTLLRRCEMAAAHLGAFHRRSAEGGAP